MPELRLMRRKVLEQLRLMRRKVLEQNQQHHVPSGRVTSIADLEICRRWWVVLLILPTQGSKWEKSVPLSSHPSDHI
jgi:hypothetical protein